MADRKMGKNCPASLLLLLLCGAALSAPLGASEPTEDDYYPITTLQIPEGVVLEAGAFQGLPDGSLAVASRRGEIWRIQRPLDPEVPPERFSRFAHGLHEPLGLAYRDGWLYATQRGDITRMRDSHGDGRADEFEIVADGWGISGDYHEYAFGSKFDRDGNQWVVLCLTGSFSSEVLYRGWCVRTTPDGRTIPTASGIRSPGGIGFNAAGDVFYTDNQGPWNGTSGLKHLIPGKFMGHPGGFRWYEQAAEVLGPQPATPESNSRIMIEADRIPELEPTAVQFPYVKMGQSASGIACDTTEGRFGPFAGQMFVGDQTQSTVMRVYLEKVQGHYQGACFPFREGFDAGCVGLEMDPSGAMFYGGTARGWGSRGPKQYCVQRIDWTGEVPFEIQEMRAVPGGFQLVFTHSIDADSAGDPEAYDLQTYDYLYRADYGSPEVDSTRPTITRIDVAEDSRAVTLHIDGLQRGHIHELHAAGVRSAEGLPLLHPVGYYTLNYLP